MDAEFQPFPKIARLNRAMVITEKIDGTNAQVWVAPADAASNDNDPSFAARVIIGGEPILVGAASRTRWISPGSDNFGFAAWVRKNAEELACLGEGRHFGEWWGLGIQRGYGLRERRFSLFNVARWTVERPACCDVVPVLFQGDFDTMTIAAAVHDLRMMGSRAALGFMLPEGVIVWHETARQMFKATLEGDEAPKSLAKAA